MCIFDGVEGFCDGEFFDLVMSFGAFSDACGICEEEGILVPEPE